MKGVYHPAAIVSAIAFYVWGFLWYGVFFGKTWAALVGLNYGQMKAVEPGPLVVSIVVALLVGYGTAIALSRGENQTARHGLEFGLFFGIVFIASLMLERDAYAHRPWMLWLIDTGYAVTGLIICGLINGGWRPKTIAAG